MSIIDQVHTVNTVERGGGFAAWCSCGELTFGGNPSRADARAQLSECVEASGRDPYGRFIGAGEGRG